MRVRILALDLDGVVWDTLDISALNPPFKKLDDYTIVDSQGVKVNLREGVRELVAFCKEMGFKVVTLSWNVREVAEEALKLFGIYELFDAHLIEFHPNKHLMLKDYLSKLSKEISDEVYVELLIYVDDRDVHVFDVVKEFPNVVFIQYGRDVKSFKELTDVIVKLCHQS